MFWVWWRAWAFQVGGVEHCSLFANFWILNLIFTRQIIMRWSAERLHNIPRAQTHKGLELECRQSSDSSEDHFYSVSEFPLQWVNSEPNPNLHHQCSYKFIIKKKLGKHLYVWKLRNTVLNITYVNEEIKTEI